MEPCVVVVDRGDKGGLFGNGVAIACCLANVEPVEAGLRAGVEFAPGDRGGRAEIGEGGTKGNLERTESARESVVLELIATEYGRLLSKSSSPSMETIVRPLLVCMLVARDWKPGEVKPPDAWWLKPGETAVAGALCIPRITREAVPISALMLKPSAVLATLTGRSANVAPGRGVKGPSELYVGVPKVSVDRAESANDSLLFGEAASVKGSARLEVGEVDLFVRGMSAEVYDC